MFSHIGPRRALLLLLTIVAGVSAALVPLDRFASKSAKISIARHLLGESLLSVDQLHNTSTSTIIGVFLNQRGYISWLRVLCYTVLYMTLLFFVMSFFMSASPLDGLVEPEETTGSLLYAAKEVSDNLTDIAILSLVAFPFDWAGLVFSKRAFFGKSQSLLVFLSLVAAYTLVCSTAIWSLTQFLAGIVGDMAYWIIPEEEQGLSKMEDYSATVVFGGAGAVISLLFLVAVHLMSLTLSIFVKLMHKISEHVTGKSSVLSIQAVQKYPFTFLALISGIPIASVTSIMLLISGISEK